MAASMESFKNQVQALKDGKFEDQAAELIVNALKAHVQAGSFTWADLDTSPVELDSFWVKQRLNPAK